MDAPSTIHYKGNVAASSKCFGDNVNVSVVAQEVPKWQRVRCLDIPMTGLACDFYRYVGSPEIPSFSFLDTPLRIYLLSSLGGKSNQSPLFPFRRDQSGI